METPIPVDHGGTASSPAQRDRFSLSGRRRWPGVRAPGPRDVWMASSPGGTVVPPPPSFCLLLRWPGVRAPVPRPSDEPDGSSSQALIGPDPNSQGGRGLAASAPPDGGARAARMMSLRGRPQLRTHATWERSWVQPVVSVAREACVRPPGSWGRARQGARGRSHQASSEARARLAGRAPWGGERRPSERQDRKQRRRRRKRQGPGRTRGGIPTQGLQARPEANAARASERRTTARASGGREGNPAAQGQEARAVGGERQAPGRQEKPQRRVRREQQGSGAQGGGPGSMAGGPQKRRPFQGTRP